MKCMVMLVAGNSWVTCSKWRPAEPWAGAGASMDAVRIEDVSTGLLTVCTQHASLLLDEFLYQSCLESASK